jgi:hypothetical protein
MAKRLNLEEKLINAVYGIKWTKDKEELDLIGKLADRYIELSQKHHFPTPDKTDLMMDIDATHSNGCPLKLKELLESKDFDFVHDISGIQANLNRKTGKLENCFDPRYSLNG